MFLHLCVILFTGGGLPTNPHRQTLGDWADTSWEDPPRQAPWMQTPLGRPPWADLPPWMQFPPRQTPPHADPLPIGPQVGGTHPNGMHTSY